MALTTIPYPFAATPLDQALHLICARMQLTKTQQERVRGHYEAVSNYLGREGGCFDQFGLTIYPQGSLRIGTTVKPIGKNEFDLDLVCHLEERAPGWARNPRRLLQLLHAELRANGTYTEKLELKNRCVRLNYAGDFHMDILPGCQDWDRCENCIEVPDQELADWSPSNPRGYAKWFEDYALNLPAILDARNAWLAVLEKAEVVPLPDDSPYTIEPLKRTVQLMKRNRDVFWGGSRIPATPSVIITTLAAQQYGGLTSIADSILAVLHGIQDEIQEGEQRNPEGRLVVLNPTNEDEDFSEKWEDIERYQAFKLWIKDFESKMHEVAGLAALGLTGPIAQKLSAMFGEQFVTPALNELRDSHPEYFRAPAKTIGIMEALTAPVAGFFEKFRLSKFSGHRIPVERHWPVAISEDAHVTVKARVTTKKRFNGHRNPFNYPSEGIPLPKHAEIKFKAQVTGISPPFEVAWRVVNTGQEAANSNQLRGGFVKGEGANGTQRTENTSYNGSHWVDAHVIKNGMCVASSAPFVVNIR